MKQNIFFSKFRKQMKSFFKNFRNKNTSFFIIVLCVCLIATALIWRYTSTNNENSQISEEQNNSSDSLEANKDPYQDYVDKTIKDYENSLENEDKYQAERISIVESFAKPIEGNVARGFNITNLVYFDTIGEWRTHQGIDIVPVGSLTINAAYNGKIESVVNSGTMGYEVVIDHGQNVKTKYSCLSSVCVKEGDSINQDSKIGTLGVVDNIEMSDGVHLHFEVSVNDVIYDPTFLYNK